MVIKFGYAPSTSDSEGFMDAKDGVISLQDSRKSKENLGKYEIRNEQLPRSGMPITNIYKQTWMPSSEISEQASRGVKLHQVKASHVVPWD